MNPLGSREEKPMQARCTHGAHGEKASRARARQRKKYNILTMLIPSVVSVTPASQHKKQSERGVVASRHGMAEQGYAAAAATAATAAGTAAATESGQTPSSSSTSAKKKKTASLPLQKQILVL